LTSRAKSAWPQADEGVEELKKAVDTLIVIPNTRLRSLAPKNAKFTDMLRKADEVLLYAVKGISDLIVSPGLFNLDFADVRTIMSEMGVALMGTGQCQRRGPRGAGGPGAVSNPLLEDVSIDGARGVLVNITASSEMSIDEVSEASPTSRRRPTRRPTSSGAIIDDNMGDDMRVTVIATGIGNAKEQRGQLRSVVNGPDIDPSAIDHMDLPRFRRSVNRNEQAARAGKATNYRSREAADLDVPTFLRRQAD
jgi:cell division protein FtsZ